MVARWILPLACAGVLAAQRTPVDTAWDLLAKGARKEAVTVLRRIIETNPRDGEARLLLGSILTEDGQGAEALSQLSEAARLMPGSAQAQNALGEAANGAGDPKRARAAFEQAVRLDPKFAQAHLNLGLALLEAGERDTAAKHLESAIANFGREPDAAYPMYLRGKIYAEDGNHEQASALLKSAVALRPDFAEAWSDLGQARKLLLDDEGAFAAFRRSVELDPANAISQYRLGAEYLKQGDAHAAIPHLRESYRLNPENQSTLYGLQLALYQAGQAEEAGRIKQKLAEVLRKIDKESQDAFVALRLNNEGAALEKAGNRREAVEKYRAAVNLDRGHVGFRVNLGVALLRLGRWPEGLAELREAVRLAPRDPVIRAALDDALEQAPVEFGGKGKRVR